MAVITINAPGGGGSHVTTERIELSGTPLTVQGVKIVGDYAVARIKPISAQAYFSEDWSDGDTANESADDYETLLANVGEPFPGPNGDVEALINDSSFGLASPTASAIVEVTVIKQ